jgi:hypothetical protein
MPTMRYIRLRERALANVAQARYIDRYQRSRRYKVFLSGEGIAHVENPETEKRYIVNTVDKTYECGNFQSYHAPCTHAIAAAREFCEDPAKLFATAYHSRWYEATYSKPLFPISIENLERDETIKPPVYRKQAGRPKTKRIRKGNWQRKQT